MSSPWAKIPAAEPSSLKNIMLEEITEEKKKCFKETDLQNDVNQEQFFDLNTDENQSNPDTDSAISNILQQEHDEHSKTLTTTEENQIYTSMFISQFKKIQVCQDKQSDISESNSDEEDIDEENLQHCNKVISKYDIKLKEPLMPSNSSVKLYSKHEQSKREKLHDKKEDNATVEFDLDYARKLSFHKFTNKQLLEQINLDYTTKLLLHRLINKRNKRLLDQINRVINESKEAVILHGDCNPSYSDATLPKECVIKIYKTTLPDFKQKEIYAKEDKHFTGKQAIRKIAEKEWHNLFILQAAGIPCPQPLLLKEHVLVMSFIGDDYAAPRLYAVRKTEELELAYKQVIELIKKLYNKARLIHGDLCEHNILWHNKQCYIIDVSHSVEPTHADAFCFLYRDCANITKFFSRKKLPNIKTAQELFIEITGFDYFDRVETEEASTSKFS